MTPEPLVSVILPTYNRAALLPRAIHSVLGQTYRNLELIVVDDASPDATSRVVGAFSDSRLRYIRLERNGRAAAARNAGIRAARGELLAFNDDDDVWLVRKLERQVPHLLAQAPDVALSICSHISEYRTHATYVGGAAHFAQLDFSGIADGAPLIATPGWLARADLLRAEGGFDERMRCWDDWELACRLAQRWRFAHLDEPLFLQDQTRATRPGGMTTNMQDFANDFRVLYERHAARWPHPRQQSRHQFFIGHYTAMFGDVHEGRRWLRRALRTRAGNLKAWASLVLSYAAPRRMQAVTLAWQRLRTRLRGEPA